MKIEIITDKATISEFEELNELWKIEDNVTKEQIKRFRELVIKYRDVNSFEIIEK